jgi:glycosyltransferase involved in cell wall biosynthesis
MKKYKILLATPIYFPDIGGPATYVKELCSKLKDIHDLEIMTYADPKNAVIFPGTKLHVVNRDKILPIRLISFFFKLLKISKSFDLIYVQNAVAAGLPVALVSIITGKHYIVKFVGDEAFERTLQSGLTDKFLEDFLEKPEGNLKTKIFQAIQKFVLKRATLVTTPSEYLGLAITKAYGLDKNKVITNYNAAESESEVDTSDLKIQKHKIVATARLTKFKGVDGIIKAVKILLETDKNKYADINFSICGDGPEMKNLQNLTKELGLENNITFLGKVSREETFRQRKTSQVYVLNSIYEGLPHTALTCFKARIPIIATNISGTNEAVYDGVSGLLVPPNDPEALAQALIKIFEDKDLREKLIDGGTEILKDKFSWEKHILNLNNFIENICK